MSAELILNLINEVLDSNLKLDKKVIKEEQDSMTLSYDAIPEIPISELGWSQLNTREGKSVPSEQRQQLINFLKRIPPADGDIVQKINELNKFFEADEKYMYDRGFDMMGQGNVSANSVSNVLAYLTFYKTLTTIITHFNASSAGFSFESFISALVNGEQIDAKGQERTIADMKDGKGTYISLKLYREGQLKVGGSFSDLAHDLKLRGEMQYLNVTKDLTKSTNPLEQEGILRFYRFNFNLDNVFNIVSKSSGKHKDCVLLPKTFLDSKGASTEGIPTKATMMPSPEQLETEYEENVLKRFKQNKEQIEKELGPVDEELIKLMIRNFNYSNSESLKSPYEHGKAKLKPVRVVDLIRSQFADRADQGEIPIKSKTTNRAIAATTLYKVFIVANDEDILKKYKPDDLAKLRRGAMSELYYYGDMSDEERRKISVDFYNGASPEIKKKCLEVAKGNVDNLQFELNQNMVKNIDQLAAPKPGNLFPEGQTKSGPIAELKIGRNNIQKMLNNIRGELNEIVFGIFKSLKSLTQQLQAYFSGGLVNNNLAQGAEDAAQEIQDQTVKARERAEAERAEDKARASRQQDVRRQARASQPAMGLNRPLEESKEFDDQLQLLMNEVFGK